VALFERNVRTLQMLAWGMTAVEPMDGEAFAKFATAL